MSAKNLPDLKKPRLEDMPGSQPWISPFLDAQNHFNEVVYGVLNGDIRYGENSSSQIYSAKFSFSGTQPEIQCKTNQAIFPAGVIVIKCSRDDNGSIDDAIGCQFSYAENIVTIRPSLNPLVNGKSYSITFLIIFQ